jgi:hypothetical protein
MNERILELAREAGHVGFTKWDYFDINKFAELIVRECAQAFEAEVDTWKEMDPYQGSIKRQGTKAIKQHFGVEE